MEADDCPRIPSTSQVAGLTKTNDSRYPDIFGSNTEIKKLLLVIIKI